MPEDIQQIMKKGKAEGRITYDEVLTAIPKAEENLELVDEIYARLSKMNVQLVDSLDKDALFKGENAPKKKEEEVVNLSDISDDSIRMYLNEIGRFPLIDAEEEIRLGRLIKK